MSGGIRQMLRVIFADGRVSVMARTGGDLAAAVADLRGDRVVCDPRYPASTPTCVEYLGPYDPGRDFHRLGTVS